MAVGHNAAARKHDSRAERCAIGIWNARDDPDYAGGDFAVGGIVGCDSRKRQERQQHDKRENDCAFRIPSVIHGQISSRLHRIAIFGLLLARESSCGFAGKADAGNKSSNHRTRSGTGFLPDLAPSPGRAGRAIFENDTGGEQLVADAIGFGEILRLARSIACRYQSVDGFRCVSDRRRGLQRIRSLRLRSTWPSSGPCRNRVGSSASNPSTPPSDFSITAAVSERLLLTSLASSNSTATASGVLKSSFIASRKRLAGGKSQSIGAALAGTALSAMYKLVNAPLASSRCTSE